jgi:hypothetical protein
MKQGVTQPRQSEQLVMYGIMSCKQGLVPLNRLRHGTSSCGAGPVGSDQCVTQPRQYHQLALHETRCDNPDSVISWLCMEQVLTYHQLTLDGP